MITRSRRTTPVIAVVLMAVLATACSSAAAGGSGQGRKLVGLFALTPGRVEGAQITGSWFRMLQPGGTVAKGPYMINGDSSADGGRATLLEPGTAGGLRSGAYQSQPSPAFDPNGNSTASAIMTPAKFFGVEFSISTNPVDPQTRTNVPPPTVVLHGSSLSADLSSWAASWNNQDFNQGAPKPVQSTAAKAPGQAQAQRVWDWVSQRWLDSTAQPDVTGADATGTFDSATGAFVLHWTSRIVGGPFNGFTGLWHLEGVFKAQAAAPSGA